MTQDGMGEYRRQVETHYRLGMHGGWTQGAIWTRRILITLTALYVLLLVGFFRIPVLFNIISPLMLTPQDVIHGKIWQIFTSPFILTGCWWQAIFHVFYLFMFGPKVERDLGNASFLRFYLIIAIISSLITFAIFLPSRFAPLAPFSTASAAIFAVMVAYSIIWPRDILYVFGLFPAPVYYIVIFLCATEFLFFFIGGANFASSVIGIIFSYLVFKVPSIKAFVTGAKKSAKVTAKSRVQRQEYSSEPSSVQPDLPGDESKRKRSKFLEM